MTNVCILLMSNTIIWVYLDHCTLHDILCIKCLVRWATCGCVRVALCRRCTCSVRSTLSKSSACSALSSSFIAMHPSTKVESVERGGDRFVGWRGATGPRAAADISDISMSLFPPTSEHSDSEPNTDLPSSSCSVKLAGRTRSRFVSKRSAFIILNQLGNMSLTTRLSQISFAGYWMETFAFGYFAFSFFYFIYFFFFSEEVYVH